MKTIRFIIILMLILESRAIYSQIELPKLVMQTGHSGRNINTLVISSDGKFLLTGGDDGSVIFWDTYTRKQYKKICFSSKVTSIAISNNNKKIAIGCRNNKIYLVDNLSDVIDSLIGHRGWVMNLDFTPDNNFLISGGRYDRAILWDLKKKSIEKYLEIGSFPNNDNSKMHPDDCEAVRFYNNGKNAITLSNKHNIIPIWDLNNLSNHDSIPITLGSNYIHTFSINKSNSILICNSGNLYDKQDKTKITTVFIDLKNKDIVKTDYKSIYTCCSKINNYAYSITQDSLFLVWDLEKLTIIKTIKLNISIYRFVLSPDETILYGIAYDIFTKECYPISISLIDGKTINVFQTPCKSITSNVAISNDGNLIAYAQYGNVRIMNLFNFETISKFTDKNFIFLNIQFSPSGKKILFSGININTAVIDLDWGMTKEKNYIFIYDIQNKEVKKIESTEYEIKFVAFTNENEIYYPRWDSHELTFINLNTSKENNIDIKTKVRWYQGCNISKSGNYIATNCDYWADSKNGGEQVVKHSIKLYNKNPEWKLINEIDYPTGLENVIFSPDEKYFISTDWNSKSVFWKNGTCKKLGIFYGTPLGFLGKDKIIITDNKNFANVFTIAEDYSIKLVDSLKLKLIDIVYKDSLFKIIGVGIENSSFVIKYIDTKTKNIVTIYPVNDSDFLVIDNNNYYTCTKKCNEDFIFYYKGSSII